MIPNYVRPHNKVVLVSTVMDFARSLQNPDRPSRILQEGFLTEAASRPLSAEHRSLRRRGWLRLMAVSAMPVVVWNLAESCQGYEVIDLSTSVGSVALPNPVMTAAGTSGHGAELAAFFDLRDVGAVVVKSLSPGPHKGNAAPRVHELKAGMINAIGLQNGGVAAWIEHDLPKLKASGARVVASLWGFTVEEFAEAATMLKDVGSEVVAFEVNISCPNTEMGGKMFAHDKVATAEVLSATADLNRPRWAKLSPNTHDIVDIAATAVEAGADGLTLTNTLVGMAIDTETRSLELSNGTGGVSGPALHPIAVRCVYQCRAALPGVPIIGVGGVATATDAVEFLMAGANAVQVGTATFANPRASVRLVRDLERWCRRHKVGAIRDIVGAAQRNF